MSGLQKLWLWSVALLCLGYTLLGVFFSTFFLLHYTVTHLKFGSVIPVEAAWLLCYVLGAGPGLAAAGMVLRSRLREAERPRTRRSLRFCSIALPAGAAAVAFIPAGELPQRRLAEGDLILEVFISLLPCLYFLYLAHGVRRRLRQD